MIPKIDLQIHSTYSDGAFSPATIVRMAKRHKVKIMAITDHDTVAGIPEALKAAKSNNLICLPAVELSVTYQQHELHLLGYGVDYKNKELLKAIKFYKKSREKAIRKMASNLKKISYLVSFNTIKNNAKSSITRPHLAEAVIGNPKNQQKLKKVFGRIPDRSAFIQKYIIKGKKAYVRKKDLSIQEVIKIYHQASGLAFLSHPLGRRYSVDIGLAFVPHWPKLLARFKKMGLDGIEVYAPDHYAKDRKNLYNLAKKYQFLISGGSDFHNLKIPGLPLGYYTKTKKIPFNIGKNLLTRLSS